MKRLSLLGLLAAGMTLLAGCPIFDDGPSDQGCIECGTGGGTTMTNTPQGTCFSQKDCDIAGINQTCGSDNFCHIGDCFDWGCVNGETCFVGTDQKAYCGTGGTGGASTGGSSSGGASTGGASSAGGTGGATSTGGASTGGSSSGGAGNGGAAGGGAAGAPAGGTGGAGGMAP